MAKVTASTSEKVFQIKNWGGLHECPDGDTKLKMGEASAMENFKVTRDGNLQRRPGFKNIFDVGANKRTSLWSGWAAGKEVFLIAVNDKIYSLWDAANGDYYRNGDGEISPLDISPTSVSTQRRCHFFGFDNKVYFLNGTNTQYLCWDGDPLHSFTKVVGYEPLVAVSIEPSPNPGMGGQLLERINRLSAYRRVWLSPDGTNKVFYLPEKKITAVDSITKLSDNSTIAATAYTVNTTDGTITFTNAPAQAVNGLEVRYHMSSSRFSTVANMRWTELFSGQTDARVFFYGDGSNKVLYSGVDYNGTPRADYVPDMNEALIGDSNTEVTALIRQYSKLVAFKRDSAWNISFDTTVLSDGNMTEALYIYPTNKRIGHNSPGQIALVLNAPRTVFGNDVYEWRNNNSYSANLSVDERQAKRISDRVYQTMRDFDFQYTTCFDDNDNQEFWIAQYNTKKALIHNYAVDAWYLYTGLNIYCLCSFKGKLYFGTSDGKLNIFGEEYDYDGFDGVDDDGNPIPVPIKAFWESGSMDFGQDYMRKYSAMTWLGIKPSAHGHIDVSVQTDRRPSSREKTVDSQHISFEAIDFDDFSFDPNQSPRMRKLKIKAKKFVYYKLIFKDYLARKSATITSADIRVRFTGYTK